MPTEQVELTVRHLFEDFNYKVTDREEQVPEDKIITKLIKHFSLTEEAAKDYMEKYPIKRGTLSCPEGFLYRKALFYDIKSRAKERSEQTIFHPD